MNIDRALSRTFMIANLVATVLVIAIHYNSKKYIVTTSGYNINYLTQEFIVNGICRVAVPFFSLISGFFLFQKLESKSSYLNTVKSKLNTLVVPYILAATIVFIAVSGLKIIYKPDFSGLMSVATVVYNIIIHPLSDQFWFLRDLIVLTCIYPIILGPCNSIRWIFIITFGMCWLFNIQPFPLVGGWYLLNIETFFLFFIGGVLYEKQSFFKRLIIKSNYHVALVFLFWLSILIARIYIDPELDVWYVDKYSASSLILYKVSILISLVSLLQLSFYLTNISLFIYLSGLTFFVYLFHLYPLAYIKMITGKVVGFPVSFYINFPLATCLVFLMAHIAGKYLPGFYYYISGGRSPQKSMKRIDE